MANEIETPELVLVAPPEQAAEARDALPPPVWPARARDPQPDRTSPPLLARRLGIPHVHRRVHKALLGVAAAAIAGIALHTVRHPGAAPTLGPRPPARVANLAVRGGGYVYRAGGAFTVSRDGRLGSD